MSGHYLDPDSNKQPIKRHLLDDIVTDNSVMWKGMGVFLCFCQFARELTYLIFASKYCREKNVDWENIEETRLTKC